MSASPQCELFGGKHFIIHTGEKLFWALSSLFWSILPPIKLVRFREVKFSNSLKTPILAEENCLKTSVKK